MIKLLNTLWGEVIVLIAGCLLPLAFAPYDFYPLAIVSPAILFLAWTGNSPRRALLRGWLFGLGMFGTGVSWIHISIYGFGGVPLLLSLFLSGLLVAFLALFPAVLGYCLARWVPGISRHTFGWKLLLVFPAAWILSEWVRGWFFTGFPWLSLGYSQTDSPLAGFAPLLGVYGVSWVVALSAALLVMLLLERQMRQRLAYGGALVSVWLLGFVAMSVHWTEPYGESIRVSLAQGNIPQDMKWLPELRQATIDLYTEMTRSNWQSDLVIWPESALPDFYHRQRDHLDGLAEEARQHNTDLLIGALTMDLDTDQYFNSMVGLGNGETFYHKQHLVPFTEYLPLKSVLGSVVDFMNVPMSDFTAGAVDQSLIEVAGQKVGISICFEDAFGEEVIRTLPEATILVNVSNDAWFADSSAPHQHLQIARMRTLEAGRPMLRGTNTGMTAIIDAAGRLQATAPQFETTVLTGDVQPMQGMTPYARWGNRAVVSGAMLLVGFGVWRVRRTARGQSDC
jgi:apolipoprotein N-acyltransferase